MRHLKGLVTCDSMSHPGSSLYHAILGSQDSLVWTYGNVPKEGKSGNLSSLLGSHLVPSTQTYNGPLLVLALHLSFLTIL
jgi:hypothetical protein